MGEVTAGAVLMDPDGCLDFNLNPARTQALISLIHGICFGAYFFNYLCLLLRLSAHCLTGFVSSPLIGLFDLIRLRLNLTGSATLHCFFLPAFLASRVLATESLGILDCSHMILRLTLGLVMMSIRYIHVTLGELMHPVYSYYRATHMT